MTRQQRLEILVRNFWFWARSTSTNDDENRRNHAQFDNAQMRLADYVAHNIDKITIASGK